MNIKGQMIMVNLLIFAMTIMVAIALLPGLKTTLDLAQQNDALNCEGYKDPNAVAGGVNHSYNSSLETQTLACVAIDLYLPYILLVVLVGGVTWILSSGRRQDQYGGGGVY